MAMTEREAYTLFIKLRCLAHEGINAAGPEHHIFAGLLGAIVAICDLGTAAIDFDDTPISDALQKH